MREEVTPPYYLLLATYFFSIKIKVLEIAGKIGHELRIDAHHSCLEDYQLGFQQLDPFAEVNYEFALLGR